MKCFELFNFNWGLIYFILIKIVSQMKKKKNLFNYFLQIQT